MSKKKASTKQKPMQVKQMKLRIPTVLFDVRHGGESHLEGMLEGVEHLDARVRVLGAEVEGCKTMFSLEEALESTDIWVFCSKKLPKEFRMVAEKGIVPVMLRGANKKALNYDPVQEEGNAFLYAKLSPWHIYGTLVRAIENFSFPYDWKNLKNHVKELSV